MRGVPQGLTPRSERGLRKTAMVLRPVDGYSVLSISQALSRRRKHREWCESCCSNWWTSRINISIYHKDKCSCIRIEYILKLQVILIPCLHCSLHFVPGNEVCKNLESAMFDIKVDALSNLPEFQWLGKKNRTVSANNGVKRICNKTVEGSWDSLPNDLQENILQRVGFKDLFRFKILSKSCKEYIESDAFRQWRGSTSSPEGLFTAINYYIKDKTWRCSGFDLLSRMWRILPPFLCLPPPDSELFKEYSVCGHGSLMCADVAKFPKKGKLVVFNPLTGEKRELPPLLYPRSPVLVHMSVSPATKSYEVIVAGSSNAIDQHLSKKMEVFNSKTSKWEEMVDLPGPAFGLNEHQAGVCLSGILYFISFLERDSRRGVVAFDVESKKWLENTFPIPLSMYSNTLQLVENLGNLHLFSEQEQGRSVEHCIDVLEILNLKAGGVKYHWRNVVRVRKSGGRGLQVYPEHTCVNFGDGKLCIFNTLNHDGVVYDMQDGRQCEVLQPPPPDQRGDNFFSLNPTSFTLQPSFDSDPGPMPSIIDVII